MKMKVEQWVTLVMMILMADGEKKTKNDRNSGPEWKEKSMPALDKRYELVHEGQTVTLNCKAQAHPKPTIKWFKDGTEVKSGDNVLIRKFNLVFKDMTSDMSGNYTCVVSNKHGQKEWTIHVGMQENLPMTIVGPENITQTVGSSASFRCQVLNGLHARIRWLKMSNNKNADEINPLELFLPATVDPEVLTLENITKEDEGEYRCLAGNVMGLKYNRAWLTVVDPGIATESSRLSDVNRHKGINGNKDSSFFEAGSNSEDIDSFDPDMDTSDHDLDNDLSDNNLVSTLSSTKLPRISGNKRKQNGLKKDRKSKNRNNVDEDVSTTIADPFVRTSSVDVIDDILKWTTVTIWQYGHDEDKDEFSDSRNRPANNDDLTDNTGSAKSEENESVKGSISSWTIYTIVGAVGGVILLIGLLAITVTVCCKRDENGIYKSTSV